MPTSVANLALVYKNKASGSKFWPLSVEVTEATNIANLTLTYRDKTSGIRLNRYPRR